LSNNFFFVGGTITYLYSLGWNLVLSLFGSSFFYLSLIVINRLSEFCTVFPTFCQNCVIHSYEALTKISMSSTLFLNFSSSFLPCVQFYHYILYWFWKFCSSFRSRFPLFLLFLLLSIVVNPQLLTHKRSLS